MGGANPVFFEEVDHTALADQMAGTDDHEIVPVVVEQSFDLGQPLAVARHQDGLIEAGILTQFGLQLRRELLRIAALPGTDHGIHFLGQVVRLLEARQQILGLGVQGHVLEQ